MAKKDQAVYALCCHLKNEQQVIFDEGSEATVLEKAKNTELTEFGGTIVSIQIHM